MADAGGGDAHPDLLGTGLAHLQRVSDLHPFTGIDDASH
jgi:hypothetical protein